MIPIASTEWDLDDFAARVLKVDHAGENGAVYIYAGQILMARLTAPTLVAELAGYKADEERHRSVFWAELQRRGRPRCKSYWLCAIGGYVLGLITGALGRGAIAATTVAVERAVLGHLRQQIEVLRDRDDPAVKTIESIIADEQQHHDVSVAHVTDKLFWSRVLSPVVGSATEAVIWIGMRA